MSRDVIYLDANSASACDPRVWRRMGEVAESAYGNPGSSHQVGRKARQVLEESRDDIARLLGGKPEELVFTSGATESTNLALMGLAATIPPTRRLLALTEGEHPATAGVAERLGQQGWRTISLPVDSRGVIDSAKLQTLPWSEIGLLTVLQAHNETGVLQDLTELARLCGDQRIPWHVDMVQSVGRIPVNVAAWQATAVSFAVHKCHGPRGIGGLFLQAGVPFVPAMVGGFQESSRRPGTEPVTLVAGMAETLKLWHAEQTSIMRELESARDHLESRLLQLTPPLIINGRDAPRLPNTSNITFPGVPGEPLLVGLDLERVCCSLGSACASGSMKPSPALLAMGIPPELARSSLRISLPRGLRQQIIDDAAERIARVVGRLRAPVA